MLSSVIFSYQEKLLHRSAGLPLFHVVQHTEVAPENAADRHNVHKAQIAMAVLVLKGFTALDNDFNFSSYNLLFSRLRLIPDMSSIISSVNFLLPQYLFLLDRFPSSTFLLFHYPDRRTSQQYS
nr:hypothetical protein [Escherichia coli]